jgi:hypothetical protein
VMVGIDIERDEDKSDTSPLTDGSGVQVHAKSLRLKPKSYLTNTDIHLSQNQQRGTQH